MITVDDMREKFSDAKIAKELIDGIDKLLENHEILSGTDSVTLKHKKMPRRSIVDAVVRHYNDLGFTCKTWQSTAPGSTSQIIVSWEE